jgi:peptidoglycan/xylan/chitin deacetylase (PgdA/CDA1 family)
LTKSLTVLLVFIVASTSLAAERQVAITIDDLPFLGGGRELSAVQENAAFREILSTLARHEVKALLFVNGSRIQDRHRLLFGEAVAAGHLIGNHTWSHPNLNTTDTSTYYLDIDEGQKSIVPLLAEVDYFRYPFLFRGDDTTKHDAVTRYLAEKNYTVVPVSIDNDDWRYNKNYAAAMNVADTAAADSIGREYLTHMQRRSTYFDSISVADFGRSIKHILLLHMTELNSVYLDSLLTWYENTGWEFISNREELTDPIYAESNQYIGSWGIYWLFRLEHPDWIKN